MATTHILYQEEGEKEQLTEDPVLSGLAYDNFKNSINSLETVKVYEFSLKKFMKHIHINSVDQMLPKTISRTYGSLTASSISTS